VHAIWTFECFLLTVYIYCLWSLPWNRKIGT